MEVYLNNKNVYDHITREMRHAESKEIYDIYKKIYDTLMVCKLNYKYFKKAGNYRKHILIILRIEIISYII